MDQIFLVNLSTCAPVREVFTEDRMGDSYSILSFILSQFIFNYNTRFRRDLPSVGEQLSVTKYGKSQYIQMVLKFFINCIVDNFALFLIAFD